MCIHLQYGFLERKKRDGRRQGKARQGREGGMCVYVYKSLRLRPPSDQDARDSSSSSVYTTTMTRVSERTVCGAYKKLMPPHSHDSRLTRLCCCCCCCCCTMEAKEGGRMEREKGSEREGRKGKRRRRRRRRRRRTH